MRCTSTRECLNYWDETVSVLHIPFAEKIGKCVTAKMRKCEYAKMRKCEKKRNRRTCRNRQIRRYFWISCGGGEEETPREEKETSGCQADPFPNARGGNMEWYNDDLITI